MNYYERYCGEYARDTAHLSLQEHGVYTVMLDTYYATEKYLPADYKALYRICRAMTGSEQAAVRKVADEFFQIASDGLRHNKRADEVLTKAQKRIAAAKANGAKANPPSSPPSGGAGGCPESNPVGDIGTASRPQTPESTKSKALSGSPDVSRSILEFLNEKTGKHYQPVDANLRLIAARLKEGATETQLRQVIAKKCREWGPDEKMADYLRPKTLFNATNFANYVGELEHGN